MTVTKFDLHQTITDQIIEASCLCRSSRRQEMPTDNDDMGVSQPEKKFKRQGKFKLRAPIVAR